MPIFGEYVPEVVLLLRGTIGNIGPKIATVVPL